MEYTCFEDLYREVEEKYHHQEYPAILAIATEQFDNFPEQQPLIYYWRFAMSAALGDREQSISLLGESLKAGLWYNEILLRKSPSLKDLQGMQAFENLIAINQQNLQQEQEHTYPILNVRPEGKCQQGTSPCPLLIGLHANTSNPRKSLLFWQPAATIGWLVAVPQSSQGLYSGAYVWDDRQIAESEVRKHHASLLNKYALDPQRVIIAGHSMGGEIALWLALNQSLPACGFIAIGPGGPYMDDIEEWEPLLNENLKPALRGYFIIGEKDSTIPQENIHALVERLNTAGVHCNIEIIPGARHDFEPLYAAALIRAISFILET
ncbi:MAG: dienelactone hydrolase family protein [Anaerolineales bacterium]|nr:dienelactone hydrolase family protein [Anaerolineales bacterium]